MGRMLYAGIDRRSVVMVWVAPVASSMISSDAITLQPLVTAVIGVGGSVPGLILADEQREDHGADLRPRTDCRGRHGRLKYQVGRSGRRDIRDGQLLQQGGRSWWIQDVRQAQYGGHAGDDRLEVQHVESCGLRAGYSYNSRGRGGPAVLTEMV